MLARYAAGDLGRGRRAGASDLVPNDVLSLDACEDSKPAGALLVVGVRLEQVWPRICPCQHAAAPQAGGLMRILSSACGEAAS